MKRAIIFCLCALLCLAGLTSVRAESSQASAPLAFNGANGRLSVVQACCMDSIIFACASDSNVYSWEAGAAEPVLYCPLPAPEEVGTQTVDCIAAGDKKLWGFNTTSGRIGELVKDEGIKWSDTLLDAAAFMPDGYSWPLHTASAFVSDGTLYVFAALDNAEYPRNNYRLLKFDLSSGNCQSLDMPDVQGFCPYDHDFLTVLQWFDGGEFAFGTFSLKTGEITESSYIAPEVLGSQTIGGLAFDFETRRLFCAADEKLWVCDADGSTTAVAALSAPSIIGATPAFFTDGSYAILDSQLTVVRVSDIIETPIETLTIMGGYADAAYSAYVQKYPGTAVVFYSSGELPTVAQIADRLVSGDSTWDIYIITVDNSFVPLKEKGYAAELTASSPLLAEFDSLYPEIKRALSTEDGVPVAYPYQLYSTEWRVNEGLWRLAFGGTALPATWQEYLEAMLLWEQDCGEAYPEMSFCSNFDYADYVLRIMNAFATQYYVPGNAMNYHQTELTEALELLEQIKQARLRGGKPVSFSYALADISIFRDSRFANVLVDRSAPRPASSDDLYNGVDLNDDTVIAPPRFGQGESAAMPVVLNAMFINPNSKHTEAALRYIECAAAYESGHRVYYAIHPQLSAPIENPAYAEKLRQYEAKRETLKSQIAQAEPGTDKTSLEDELAYVEKKLAYQDGLKWELSPDTISGYRAMAAHMRVLDDIPYVLGTGSPLPTEIDALIKQYADSAITLEQFINGYEQKMRMRQLESASS